MESLKQLFEEAKTDAIAEVIVIMENNGLKVTPKPLDGGGGSAYAQCVAAHAGQCGTCDQAGGFTPCS